MSQGQSISVLSGSGRVRIDPRFLIALLLIGAALWAAPAGGDQDRPPTIRRLEFEGNSQVDDGSLRDVIRTEASSFLHTRRLNRRHLDDDAVEIVKYYESCGFLEAEVTATQVEEDAEGGCVVTFVIREGRQTIIAEIRVFGNLVINTRRIARELDLKSGKPLRPSIIPQDEFRIYALYADEGFFRCEVSHMLIEREDGVVLTYLIDEGERVYLGGVSVRGNEQTRRLMIARELVLRSGDVFRRKDVLLSQQRIYETGLLVDVEMEPRLRASDRDTVDLVIRVREERNRWVGMGVGYGTRDLLRLSGEWGHRNLWGTGRQVGLEGVMGTGLFPAELNKFRAQVRYLEPWLAGTRNTGIVTVYEQHTYEHYAGADFWLRRTGAMLSARRKVGERIRTWLSYGYESVEVPSDLVDFSSPEVLRDLGLERDGETSIVEFIFERDMRDHFFEPSRGSMSRLSVGLAGGPLGGTNEFGKITGFWNYYIQFSPRSVLSFKINAGWVNRCWGDGEVPAYERFRTGGPTSVRGYQEDEIEVPGRAPAPGDSTGTLATPGSALLVTKVEITFPLFWKLGGTVFLDGGNVWSDFKQVKGKHFLSVSDEPNYYRYSTGVGLWIATPVGPLQIGYGIKLRPGLRAGDIMSSASGWVIFGQSL
ncbi:MAG: BamA/TamA family outer membrane protein [Candidatus Eisenbacteria sp.]|nr:BamA/TamA family outer membrane protein [Candidatus Eisenbacteria bacterium]